MTRSPTPQPIVRGETALLERERELEAVEGLIERARDRRGGIAVLEGSSGVGKSELMRESRSRARAAGLVDLHATGSELERSFAFGVVRQLLEPPLGALDPAARRSVLADAAGLAAPVLGAGAPGGATPQSQDAQGEDPFAVLHGLYWLCANLAERGPLLLALDDAHWADAASLRFLAYLARRLEGMAVALLITLRRGEPGTAERLISGIQREPLSQTLPLSALSEAASAAIVRSLLASAADEFCRACHAATGGKPFYLREIARTLASERIEPTAAEAPRIERMHTEAISRAVLARVMRLPEAAARLARAASVFERGFELRQAAALAQLDEPASHAAADALVAADVLAPAVPLEFVHPVVRNSLYSELGPAERMHAHTRAARILAEDGAPPESTAAHVLAGERRADAWTVEVLSRAAAEARRRGAPEAAARYLRRALEEPPAEELHGELLYELGAARFASGELSGVEEMRQGVEAATDPERKAEMALAAARCLVMAERSPEAVEVLDHARVRLREPDGTLGRRLESEAIGAALLDRATLPRALDDLRSRGEPSGETLPDRLVLAYLAWHRASGGVRVSELLPLIERIRPSELIGEDTLAPFLYAVYALTFAERYDDALNLLDQAAEWASRSGSAVGFELVSGSRASVEYRRGRLRECEAYSREAIAMPSAAHWQPSWGMVWLAAALIEQGRLDEAGGLLGEPSGGSPERMDASYLLFFARGALNRAQGETRHALEDYLECGRRLEAWGAINPQVAPWRSEAAFAHVGLGESDEARRLAGAELELARAFEAPRALGIALRACGLVQDGTGGIALLEEAVSVLEASDARLELARALTDYGAAIRRSGRRSAARDPLRRGLDLAHRCGAAPLAERAREELVAAGARPRRMAIGGVEALTPSELRVARMAAEGMTNREIAQALFVTMKTVAVHLTHTYQKLEIESREQLPEALREEPEQAAAVSSQAARRD